MRSFFEARGDFRKFLRGFSHRDALMATWACAKDTATKPFRVDDAGPLFPWEAPLLAREAILHCYPNGSQTLNSRAAMSRAAEFIRELDDAAYARSGEIPDVLMNMQRVAHRQFAWQSDRMPWPLIRALKVFSHPDVEPFVVKTLGATTFEWITLASGLTGHFGNSAIYRREKDRDFEVLGVPSRALSEFFARTGIGIDDLKQRCLNFQSLDHRWLYTWNPLVATPLVAMRWQGVEHFLCPVPLLLLQRATTGLFYDLVDVAGFGNAFGRAFEHYIGEILHSACPPPFIITKLTPYFVKKQRHDGTDWICSDTSGHIFVEAKTKRPSINSKVSGEIHEVEKDLAHLATAIAQNYKNIQNAMDGHTGWKYTDGAVYSMIVTLEDWRLVGPSVQERIQALVAQKLSDAEIDASIMDRIPYCVASAHEFEIGCQLMNKLGIERVMKPREEADHARWMLLPYFWDQFPDEMRDVRPLFHEELKQHVNDLCGKD